MKGLKKSWLLLILILFLQLLFCTSKRPEFDAEKSFQYLVDQTDLGSRVPGTEAHSKAVDMFIEHFRNCGAVVHIDSSTFTDTVKNISLPVRNIVARFNPEHNYRILFGAHYDSRPMCDKDPVPKNQKLPLPAANDGASGVAVLMEIANIVKDNPPEIGFDIVLFDLEDWGDAGHLDYFCIGSKQYAQSISASTYNFAIVVDMIGDSDQQIYKEQYSLRLARPIVTRVWDLAKKLKIDTFKPQIAYKIYDDHVPFLQKGIPTIDIIDFDYPYWHTIEDTPDKCSPAALGNVGKILVALLYD